MISFCALTYKYALKAEQDKNEQLEADLQAAERAIERHINLIKYMATTISDYHFLKNVLCCYETKAERIGVLKIAYDYSLSEATEKYESLEGMFGAIDSK
jgi:hypothetical protein